jgi:hypothetical protein
MADALEFTTVPKERAPEGVTPEEAGMAPLKVDGVTYWCRRPKDALIAQLGTAMSRRTNPLLRIQILLDFLEDCLVEPGRSDLRGRLLDEDDDFDAGDALAVVGGIADYWKAHPEALARR